MKNMKKKLKIIGLFIIVFLYQSVFAKEVQVFFIAEGGNTNTNGFKIIDDYLQKTDGAYCATYSSSEKIINLNSINGKKFTIFKNGTNLVKGREWYTYNYSNNKLYYFNQNNSYNVTDILQKLSLASDPYPVISLFAHWKDDGVDGGIDIGGVSKEKKNTSSAIKLESISLKGNHEISKKKSTTLKVIYNPSNAKKEKITWSSSNEKIATVTKNGKVTGISNGETIITAKTSSGIKTTFKVTVSGETHYVIIKYHMNNGKLSSKCGEKISTKDNYVLRNNNINVQKIEYNSKTTKAGLANYNSEKHINIEREGFIAKKDSEWNTKPDGSGKSFSHNKVYKASDFCDASKKDCVVTLYVNWQRAINPQSIMGSIYFPPLQKEEGSNATVIKSNDGSLALIDAHIQGNCSKLNDYLHKYAGKSSNEVVNIKYLIFSHSHEDHRGCFLFNNEDNLINSKKIKIENIVVKEEHLQTKLYNDVLKYISLNPNTKLIKTNSLDENHILFLGKKETYPIKLHLFNLKDEYYNKTINPKCLDSKTKAIKEYLLYQVTWRNNNASFNNIVSLNQNGKKVYPYIKDACSRKNIIQYTNNEITGMSNNNTGNQYYYFTLGTREAIECDANANSIVVLLDIPTNNNRSSKYALITGDIENNGYPFEGKKYKYNNHDYILYGNRHIYKINNGRLVSDNEKTVYTQNELETSIRVRNIITKSRLDDLFLYETPHHGLNIQPETAKILNLNRKNIYIIAARNDNGKTSGMWWNRSYNCSLPKIKTSEITNNTIEKTYNGDYGYYYTGKYYDQNNTNGTLEFHIKNNKQISVKVYDPNLYNNTSKEDEW